MIRSRLPGRSPTVALIWARASRNGSASESGTCRSIGSHVARPRRISRIADHFGRRVDPGHQAARTDSVGEQTCEVAGATANIGEGVLMRAVRRRFGKAPNVILADSTFTGV